MRKVRDTETRYKNLQESYKVMKAGLAEKETIIQSLEKCQEEYEVKEKQYEETIESQKQDLTNLEEVLEVSQKQINETSEKYEKLLKENIENLRQNAILRKAIQDSYRLQSTEVNKIIKSFNDAEEEAKRIKLLNQRHQSTQDVCVICAIRALPLQEASYAVIDGTEHDHAYTNPKSSAKNAFKISTSAEVTSPSPIMTNFTVLKSIPREINQLSIDQSRKKSSHHDRIVQIFGDIFQDATMLENGISCNKSLGNSMVYGPWLASNDQAHTKTSPNRSRSRSPSPSSNIRIMTPNNPQLTLTSHPSESIDQDDFRRCKSVSDVIAGNQSDPHLHRAKSAGSTIKHMPTELQLPRSRGDTGNVRPSTVGSMKILDNILQASSKPTSAYKYSQPSPSVIASDTEINDINDEKLFRRPVSSNPSQPSKYSLIKQIPHHSSSNLKSSLITANRQHPINQTKMNTVMMKDMSRAQSVADYQQYSNPKTGNEMKRPYSSSSIGHIKKS
jgi:hypothetical protein